MLRVAVIFWLFLTWSISVGSFLGNDECGDHEFQCSSDGTCIDKQLRCNHHKDCPDNSDEISCKCSQNEFLCDNGDCVNYKYYCNQIVDCKDRSDEKDCKCPDGTTSYFGGCIGGNDCDYKYHCIYNKCCPDSAVSLNGRFQLEGRDPAWRLQVVLVISQRLDLPYFMSLLNSLNNVLQGCFGDGNDSNHVRVTFWYKNYKQVHIEDRTVQGSAALRIFLDNLYYDDVRVTADVLEMNDAVTADLFYEALNTIKKQPPNSNYTPYLMLISDFISIPFADTIKNDTDIDVCNPEGIRTPPNSNISIRYSLIVQFPPQLDQYYKSFAGKFITRLDTMDQFQSRSPICNVSISGEDEPTETTVTILKIVSGVTVVAALLAAFAFFRYLKNKWKWKREVLGFAARHHRSSTTNIITAIQPFDEWEIDHGRLIVKTSEVLGSGAYGNVYKATLAGLSPLNVIYANSLTLPRYEDCDAAVKMLPEYMEGHMSPTMMDKEMAVMKKVGFHENLVNLIGCRTAESPRCLVLEYCPYGDLLHYIRNRRQRYTAEPNYQSTETLSEIDLISFAWQTSNGMAYLSSKNIIHRDLAARNILIAKEKIAKVADFGLSRHTENNVIYSSMGGRMPVKWMAIESLKECIFTTKSDVWSFGVLLWEMFSLGAMPYASIDPADMVAYLDAGKRLAQPKQANDQLFSLMFDCWLASSVDRLSFVTLRSGLSAVLMEANGVNHGYTEVLNTTANDEDEQSWNDYVI